MICTTTIRNPRRLFSPSDDRPFRPPPLLVSKSLWNLHEVYKPRSQFDTPTWFRSVPSLPKGVRTSPVRPSVPTLTPTGPPTTHMCTQTHPRPRSPCRHTFANVHVYYIKSHTHTQVHPLRRTHRRRYSYKTRTHLQSCKHTQVCEPYNGFEGWFCLPSDNREVTRNSTIKIRG